MVIQEKAKKEEEKVDVVKEKVAATQVTELQKKPTTTKIAISIMGGLPKK